MLIRRYLKLFFFLICTFWLNAQNEFDQYQESFDKVQLHSIENEVDLGILELETVLQEAEKNGKSKLLIAVYHRIAELYLENKNIESANFYLSRTRLMLSQNLYPFANAYQKYLEGLKEYKVQERSSIAQRSIAKAEALFDESQMASNDIKLLEKRQYLRAKLSSIQDDNDEAEELLNALVVKSDDLIKLKAARDLAQWYLSQDRSKDAIYFANLALDLSLKYNLKKLALALKKVLIQAYYETKNYEKALGLTLELIEHSDLSVVSSEQISDSTITKTVQRQQGYIENLQDKISELNRSNSRSELTAILSSAILTIITIVTFTLYRNNQIKLKTNDLLANKNRELIKARDNALIAMKTKMDFLSTVTHELRTPLYAITGLTHLLIEEEPNKSQKEHLKSLKYSGDYLMNFINDILQINKIEADEIEPLKIEFQLEKLLDEALEGIRVNAKKKGVNLQLHYDQTIPYKLLGDPAKLTQVFMNLLMNADKFTKEGQIEIVAKIKKQDEKFVTVYFEVSDTGIGISEEQQQYIFESFKQGSVQINRKYGGTGLGLTIVKSLLGLFNSNIHIDSELNVGTTFFFDLTFEYEFKTEEEQEIKIGNDYEILQDKHLLLVEDNKINQVITKKMLTKKGMSCDIVATGNDAIDHAKNTKYDAILMDIHMPGISGEEATIQIRKFDKKTPIIALTAISQEDSQDNFYKAGCNAVVTKPFKPNVFYDTIKEFIESNSRLV
tara:strand:- start:26032 stop:28221 length:2190 start_codon:yes stop_codon:yes gene_type:complete